MAAFLLLDLKQAGWQLRQFALRASDFFNLTSCLPLQTPAVTQAEGCERKPQNQTHTQEHKNSFDSGKAVGGEHIGQLLSVILAGLGHLAKDLSQGFAIGG